MIEKGQTKIVLLRFMSFMLFINHSLSQRCVCSLPENPVCQCFIWPIAALHGFSYWFPCVLLCKNQFLLCSILLYHPVCLWIPRLHRASIYSQYLNLLKEAAYFWLCLGPGFIKNHYARLAGWHAIFYWSLWNNVNTASFAYLTKLMAISSTFPLY